MNNRFNIKKLLLFSCIAPSLLSCQGNKGKGAESLLDEAPVVAEKVQINNSELISCDFSKLKETLSIPLSFFTEELQMTKLDNRDEALVSNSTTLVTDHYILVRNRQNNPFKLFDKQGQFLAAIGAYGQGPNEYQNVYDEYLDEESGQIFILPWQARQVLRFNLKGEALDPIPLCYPVPKGKIFVNAKKSNLSVALLPFAGLPAVAWTQDFDGNLMNSIPAGHLSIDPDFSNEVFSGKNTSAFDYNLFTFFNHRPDSLYHYNMEKNILEAKFTLDFKGQNWAIHSYGELPKYFISDVSIEKKLTENTSTTQETKWIIVDKKTLRGAFFTLHNDYLGNIPIEWPSFYNGYYVWNVDPGSLKDKLEVQLKTDLDEKERTRLKKLYDSIDKNDNNYVFYAKIKN